MLQSARKDELVYANKFYEQEELVSMEGYLFGYSKESSQDTYNLNTEEWGTIHRRETIEIMRDKDGYSFSWKIKEVPGGR